jgi:Universal stress protein family
MHKYHHGSRTFIVGLDHKSYSQYALEWGMNELFEDNDEIVILRVIDSSGLSADAVVTPEKAPLDGEKELKVYQVEAKRLLADVIRQNKDDKAVLILTCRTNVVQRRRGTCPREIPRPSPENGTTSKDPLT